MRVTPLAAQRARSAQLDQLRCARPLTRAEANEADNLAHRLYMRVWHAQLNEAAP